MEPWCPHPRVQAWWAFLKQLQSHFFTGSSKVSKEREATQSEASLWGPCREQSQLPNLTLWGPWLGKGEGRVMQKDGVLLELS